MKLRPEAPRPALSRSPLQPPTAHPFPPESTSKASTGSDLIGRSGPEPAKAVCCSSRQPVAVSRSTYPSAGKGKGGYAGGLSIPSTDAPDYADFLHFALILGMTFQTADIDITSRSIRIVSTGQCLAAFVFNIGILAFSINMIAGG